MKKKHKVAWENVLENRVFSTMSEAYKDTQTYCRLMGIKFNEYKHVKMVVLWLDEN